jgi:16S rRNA (cytosine967-C5)-methyltransferase
VRASGAAVEDLSADFPGMAHPRLPEALLTLPHRHGTDGFFVARLRAVPGSGG